MNVKVPRGKFVAAISGGVDSMALLYMLTKQPGVKIVVAHFNHGIRGDSYKDELLVEQAAGDYGLVFESSQGKLGVACSEDAARKARYAFLEDTRLKHAADKIITAHHQDDLIETAFINLLRGTGRRGLSSITANPAVLRPFMSVSKLQIIEYARGNNLLWREDISNTSEKYLRNNLRANVLNKLTNTQRQKLLINLDKVAKANDKIDKDIATLSQTMYVQSIDRSVFSNFPVEVGNEIMAFWLRKLQIKDYDSKTVNRLNMAIRTSKVSSGLPIKNGFKLKISRRLATFVTP